MEFVSGNIFVRPSEVLKKGEKVRGHTHHFDHTTFVWVGSIRVRGECPDGRIIERSFNAGQWCLIKAEVKHEITALEDGTRYACVYAHRTAQGDVVQEFTGWIDAYG